MMTDVYKDKLMDNSCDFGEVSMTLSVWFFPKSIRLENIDIDELKIFTQKYLNHSQYGLGSGKAEEIKEFVKGSKVEKIIVDEHLTSKQIHNLEKLTGARVNFASNTG